MFRTSALLAALAASSIGTQGHAQRAAIAHPALWPRADSPAAITDAATEARITKLIARMSVEQKVGQTIQADISAITPADLDRYPLGSILAGGNSGPNGNERSTAAQWRDLVRRVSRSFATARRRAGSDPDPVWGGRRSRAQQHSRRDDFPAQHRARRGARSKPDPPHRRGYRQRSRGDRH